MQVRVDNLRDYNGGNRLQRQTDKNVQITTDGQIDRQTLTQKEGLPDIQTDQV